ncbi:MAG: aldehyde dehydrogenase family protein [Gammaproteobacteria bacterium]|nr:MAG: aldehyde dehydrogenase family protein [Gammaproteobacteria bacterium]
MSSKPSGAVARYPLNPSVRDFISAPRRMLIGADWVAAASGETIDVVDPASEELLTTVPSGGEADIERAVRAAHEAFAAPSWRDLYPTVREKLILKLADLVEAHAEELAQLEALDNGKSVMMAQIVDVGSSVSFIRYMAGWATKIEGSTIEVSPPMPGVKTFAFTRKEPIGVVGAIIPWNFPLLMAIWKVTPALVAGCTVVLKPAEQTPLSALRFAELVLEAGFPPGVLNVVTGYGHTAGAALARHPGISKIAFTGSTSVGKRIGHAAMDNLTRVSLELGGKSPMIVLADASLDLAIEGLAGGIFFNHGQVCTAGSRLYAHRKVFDKVVEGVAGIASQMKLGPGLDPTTQMGPLVSAEQRDRVCRYIESGLASGARAVAGGGPAPGKGYFVKPTVLVDTREDMAVVCEEIFGPVLVVAPFDDLDEAVRLANGTRYGLAASIWSNDLSTVHRLIPRLQAGTVWVNAHNVVDAALPFGGFKESGIGREMAYGNIEMYTETKSVLMFI